MVLELKTEIIYGPVRSRRLGRSLGINLLPARHKVCSFDCVYCQYGWSAAACPSEGGTLRSKMPSVEEIVVAVIRALQALDQKPAFLTFSGNGEPTLHPELPAIIDALLRLRDRLAPQARTAILSNATTLGDAEIRSALTRLDARIMKLDAGDEERFQAFNHPAAGVQLDRVLEGLAGLPDLTLQSLIASGAGGNDSPDHLEHWLQRVSELSPRSVQVYTLARPTAATDLRPAPPELLGSLARRLRRSGVNAEVFGNTAAPAVGEWPETVRAATLSC